MHALAPRLAKTARAFALVTLLLAGATCFVGCGTPTDPAPYDTSPGSSGGTSSTTPGTGGSGTYDTEPGGSDYASTAGSGSGGTYDTTPGTGDTGTYDTTPGTSDTDTYDTTPGTSDTDTYDTTPGTSDTGTYDTTPGTDATTPGAGDYDTEPSSGDGDGYDTDPGTGDDTEPVTSPVVDAWDLADDGWYEISNREALLSPYLLEVELIGDQRAASLARGAPYFSWAQVDAVSGIGAKTLIHLSQAGFHISGDDGREYIRKTYPSDYAEAFGGSDGEPDSGYDTLPGDL